MSMSVVNDTPYEAAEILRSAKPNFHPRIALILGSGLGLLPIAWKIKPRFHINNYLGFRSAL